MNKDRWQLVGFLFSVASIILVNIPLMIAAFACLLIASERTY